MNTAAEARGLAALHRPVDIASLALFRMLFGVLMATAMLRFAASGLVEQLFVEPSYFFKYPGFTWVFVPGPEGLYLLVGAATLGAVGIALGLFYRVSAALFFGAFAWIQLMDQTNYLNHYYLVVLLSGLLLILPAHRHWSLDVWRRPALRRDTIPTWMLHLLQLQIAVVYFYAGLAKLSVDWLIHAQPMGIWMASRTSMPLLGPLLGEPWVVRAMCWAGFLYDLTIAGWLLWPRTRRIAYGLVLTFHTLTWILFPIGMFPFIMTAAATLFFAPGWPRRLLRAKAADAAQHHVWLPRWPRLRTALAGALVAFCLAQCLLPLRHYLYPGNVLWNEEGMRFSWKVMVREKNGALTYHVRSKQSDRRWQVSPHDYLNWRQAKEMAVRPEMIWALGKHIAWDFAQKGHGEVEVRAETRVSLNGRPSAQLVDAKVDLTQIASAFDVADWILPEPEARPLPLRRLVAQHR